jgi:23S rRNA (cytosine1962-C5)-methyltransferase
MQKSALPRQPMSDPAAPDNRITPHVELRSTKFRTFIYKKMIRRASPDANPGDLVTVYDKHGEIFGHAIYNPRSLLALRMLNFDATPIDEAFWRDAIRRAVTLRTETLHLPDTTNAYRLIHAEGDNLSGLIVDRYDDTLAIEIFSHGMWRIIDQLLPILHAEAGTRHHRVSVDPRVQTQEGFTATTIASEEIPKTVKITENGVRFRVHFDTGHKTGFFCDQRDNRRRLTAMTRGADVLDLCCYSGGFGLYAATIGQAADVTCVDLDENAVAMAKSNANLNNVRLNTVKADVFTYMRQMQENRKLYDVVVLDPPKLIFGKNDGDEGRFKYSDMNRLAATLVKPGGIFLTCSCSGALNRDDFEFIATSAARRAGRECQILDTSSAAPDHPVTPRCQESSYLKAIWLRLA